MLQAGHSEALRKRTSAEVDEYKVIPASLADKPSRDTRETGGWRISLGFIRLDQQLCYQAALSPCQHVFFLFNQFTSSLQRSKDGNPS